MDEQAPTYPNNLRAMRHARELSLPKLAERVNTTHGTIQRLETGGMQLTDRWAKLLAAALQCQPRDLFHGDVEPLETPIQQVPQISWVKASNLTPEAEPLEAGDYERLVPYPSKRTSLVALRVISDSMDRVAPKDSIIIVDYRDIDLVDGAFYVFRTDGATTFKRYRSNPKRLEPYSTNPEHEIIFPQDEVEVVGRVTDVMRSLL